MSLDWKRLLILRNIHVYRSVFLGSYPDIHGIYQKFGFGYRTVNDLKISNIKKMLNTFDGLLIAFEYYQFAINLSSLRTSIIEV
jgi:hypothetical protein